MFDPFKFASNRFPYLGTSDVAALVKTAKVISLKSGDVFIRHGEVDTRTAFIVSGLFRTYCITSEGDEVTQVFKKEYELIGSIPSMLFNEPASEQIEAIEDTLILLFDFKNFRELAKKNRSLSSAYTSMIEDMLHEAIDRIQDFTVLSAEQRYVKFESENRKMMQRIPLKHLASYLGIAVPSLSRIRARLAKSGN